MKNVWLVCGAVLAVAFWNGYTTRHVKLDGTVSYAGLYSNTPGLVRITNHNDFDWNNVIIEVAENNVRYTHAKINKIPAHKTRTIQTIQNMKSPNYPDEQWGLIWSVDVKCDQGDNVFQYTLADIEDVGYK